MADGEEHNKRREDAAQRPSAARATPVPFATAGGASAAPAKRGGR